MLLGLSFLMSSSDVLEGDDPVWLDFAPEG
jgi:hypothetical protein